MKTVPWKWVMTLLLSGLLSGVCSHAGEVAVMVSTGGDVSSLSGTRDCPGGTVCEYSLWENSETFTAQPREGYEFEQWSDTSGRYCAGSTETTCEVRFRAQPSGWTEKPVTLGVFIIPIFRDPGVDSDEDGEPDHLDEDDDNDGLVDLLDPCPLDPDPNCE